MSKFIDISALQDFSIVEFLARLGHHPVRKTGRDHFYHSMLRETGQNTPSLTVWDEAGKWKDWGGANQSNIFGGGIIQLGMAYWPGMPYVELLNKISEVCNLDPLLIPNYLPPVKYPVESNNFDYKYELVRTSLVGSNFILRNYLLSRGILDVANGYLHDIYYRHKNDPEDHRTFYAVGWQNKNQGWEFTTANGFKSSIGGKDISLVQRSPSHAALFEGYMDFLSWLKMHQPAVMPTIIVLNSITQLASAIKLVKDFPVVDVYFDNDAPGQKCTSDLIANVPHAIDRSGEYLGHKDYNEKLMHEMQNGSVQKVEAPEEIANSKTGRNR